MRYRKLGRTDLELSVVSIGCWGMSDERLWGPQSEVDAIEAIRTSLNEGVNVIDTAEGYGHGQSELIVAKAIAGRRHEAVLCSKVSPENHGHDDLVAACERSLKRLGTDYLDLYMLHWPNRDIGFEEPMRAMELLREQGKIRHAGVSNFAMLDLLEILKYGRIEADQVPYNLLWRVIEDDTVPACVEHGVGVLCYSPLLQGVLTGAFRTADDVPAGQARSAHFSGTRPMVLHDEPGAERESFETVDAIREIASRTGYAMSDLTLAWLVSRPGVASVVAGARNATEAARNAIAGNLELSGEILDSLDRVTEGLKVFFAPGGPDLWRIPGRMR